MSDVAKTQESRAQRQRLARLRDLLEDRRQVLDRCDLLLVDRRMYQLTGSQSAREAIPLFLGLIGLLTVGSITDLVLKKTKRLR